VEFEWASKKEQVMIMFFVGFIIGIEVSILLAWLIIKYVTNPS